MFVIGRVSPRGKGSAFYVGDFKMLAELLPGNTQRRAGAAGGDEGGMQEGKEPRS